MSLEQEIKERAIDLGFDAAGITDASPIGCEHIEHFQTWLARGYAGPLDYMHRNLDKRIEPARLRHGAQSVIVVALNYKPQEGIADCGLQIAGCASHGTSGRNVLSPPERTVPAVSDNTLDEAGPTAPESRIRNPKSAIGKVALYAQREDYHPFIKARLQELAGFLSARTGRNDRFKICVDSAPVAEKALAARAGLGFIGRNHLLIHPQLGPQVLLGELVTSLPLQPDEPCTAACHDCDRCTNACPTGALQADGFFDARKCISCITQYPPQAEPLPDTHGWLFGCDECLLACPFHQQAPASSSRHFKHHADRARPDLHEILALDAASFETKFRDSPIRRLGLPALHRTAERLISTRIHTD